MEYRYLGIETEIDGQRIIKAPKNRTPVRKILESSGYILYRVAEDNGFVDRYSIAINDLTRISDPAGKIVMLAAECITGPDHSIHLHTGIPELKEKEIRDLIDLLGSNDPDIIAILEKSMAKYIIDEFGLSGIVYDLSAIRYYGSYNELAQYGHYYHMNGRTGRSTLFLPSPGNMEYPCITDPCQAIFLPCQPYPHSQKRWWTTGSLRS